MNLLSLIFLGTVLLTTGSEPLQGSGDFMRETGKIYVVYAVLSIVFIGIVLFLMRLERKINKLEKRIENEQ